ncbi:saccharopine dehydrogenase family protein [Capilliphycus salinus ALCB114379]|uniref:saccharopine dehydrogenase family protein n=1 Tax=Capilliphycus salinus TaxID=2768948 RepID=UPI0039A4AF2E
MKKRILILGGRGRVGSRVAEDLINFTPEVEIVVTGRKASPTLPSPDPRMQFLELELAEENQLKSAIESVDLVIHCAGPFHYRDATVLKMCIEAGVNYIDVSDNRSFTLKALSLHNLAQEKGITAVINTGIFPGISNSLVRLGVEELDEVETIHLSYVVGGSGGAGITVMRTTFLGLQRPFQVWKNGQWEQVKPYSDREVIPFPAPYGKLGVYWFDMPECYTLAQSFDVKTVVTKFGTFPDFYNYLTGMVAHQWPPSWLQNTAVIEFLSQVSYAMTTVTDYFSGIGVAVRASAQGYKGKKPVEFCSTLTHENTAIAAGIGTGSVGQLLLTNQLNKPGVWPIEQALPTDLFKQTLEERHVTIESEYLAQV